MKKILLSIVLSIAIFITKAQTSFSYNNPQEFTIANVVVSGSETADKNVIIQLSGLTRGSNLILPSDQIGKAIHKIWEQDLFSDIQIFIVKTQGKKIYLEIALKDRPRLSDYQFSGLKKGEVKKIQEELSFTKGKTITENIKLRTKNKVTNYFIEKGFLNTEVTVSEIKDTKLKNNVVLNINVNKNEKVKINTINFYGNEAVADKKLKRLLKKNKEKRFYRLSRSKLNKEELETEKATILAYYNSLGHRDAKVIKDSIYKFDNKSINIDITVSEGNKYYFRNIEWIGNSKYSSQQLTRILGIKKGDIYNQERLNSLLFMNPNGTDISSLYLDDGYLFFQLTPVETFASGDSIDIELRVYEGKQAIVNKVTVVGNTKTNDHVIMREIRTKPGELFKRSDIIRTQRELSQLRYFNPEKLAVNPKPNPADGTVDIEYVVEEQASDQLELSGGWGGTQGIVGTLGISFNNFSIRNLFSEGGDGSFLPSGDGQSLSLRVQSTGERFQSYNFSFTEPWLGGKKPNSLSLSAYYTRQTNGLPAGDDGFQKLGIFGTSVGFGKRLKFPDDFFILQTSANYQRYNLSNWNSFIFQNGFSNNFSLSASVTRSSIFGGVFPTSGSKFKLSLQVTPSVLFNPNNPNGTDQEKFKWAEYHKWKFTSEWLTPLSRNKKLVLSNRAGFGFLGHFNDNIGTSPFERFYLGGSGLTGFTLDAREIIALRGYDDQSITPSVNFSAIGGSLIAKYSTEVRYALSTNPSATIYALAFAEAGNTWNGFDNFNPFKVNRSAGVGLRLFLPMFGLLGFDYGWPFDKIPQGYSGSAFTQDLAGQFHFTIGMNLGEL